MTEWYRENLKERIPPLIEKWTNKIGVNLDDWQVKKMRTKWGTCNIEAKRIWLTSNLLKKPIDCLEYIIVHELVHFIERNHSDKYIGLMNKFLTNWRISRDKLNEFILSFDDWEEKT